MEKIIKDLQKQYNLETRHYKGIQFVFGKDADDMTKEEYEEYKINKMERTYQQLLSEGKVAVVN